MRWTSGELFGSLAISTFPLRYLLFEILPGYGSRCWQLAIILFLIERVLFWSGRTGEGKKPENLGG